MQLTQEVHSVGTKQLISFLLAGVLGLAVLQTAKAQDNAHVVSVDVNSINKIVAPGEVTITVDPSESDIGGNLTGTGTGTYGVISNIQESVEIDVSGNQGEGQNTDELERLEIVTSQTDVPGDASVSSGPVSLLNNGVPRLTDEGFEGVNTGNLNVKYLAEVSPDFDPTETAEVVVTYTLTGN